MKSKVTTLGVLFFAAGAAFGTVSINFSDDFNSGVPQGLSNIAGVPTNGLTWGIIVDGVGNGLVTTPGAYNVPSFAAGSSTVLGLAAGGNSDDVLYISTSGPTASTAGNTEGDGTTKGGVGGIFDIVGIALANGVGTGDKFYVVWFDGNVAGTLTDNSFVIPADSASVALADPFVGVDPNRSAGLAYVGTSGTSTGLGVSFVPEPSAALLGAVGALGLLRRRRN
jgi:MYXO-CTERM domain-containing protein